MQIETSNPSTPSTPKSITFQITQTKSEISSLLTEINSHIFLDKYFIDEDNSMVPLLKKIVVIVHYLNFYRTFLTTTTLFKS